MLVIDASNILTVENLRKWGIARTSHCDLCLNHEETIHHMFVDCLFAHEVWSCALDGLQQRLIRPQYQFGFSKINIAL
jgi:hypothetical protein